MEVAEAFAGFSPGEADGLRRAMSRKRSEELLERQRERFVGGRDAPRRRRRARRPSGYGRWSRASPASAFPRPTAPPSACSPTSRRGCACTTARSSCARCSTSSRWASTRPTASCTRPSGAGSRYCGLDVNASEVRVHGAGRRRAPRPRLRQGRHETEMGELVAERERDGPLREPRRARRAHRRAARDARAAGLVGRLRRDPPGRAALGDADRRSALWQLGMAAPPESARRASGTQLALPLELPDGAAPAFARALAAADRRLLDQRRDGRRPRDGDPARAPGRADARHQRAARAAARGGEVAVAGLVIARQRPGHRERDDVPAVRGRVGHGQPDRAQGGLRAPSPPRPSRAAAARARARWSAQKGSPGVRHRARALAAEPASSRSVPSST